MTTSKWLISLFHGTDVGISEEVCDKGWIVEPLVVIALLFGQDTCARTTILDIVHQRWAVDLQKAADLEDNVCSLLQRSASPESKPRLANCNPMCQQGREEEMQEEEEVKEEKEEEGGERRRRRRRWNEKE